MITFALIFMDPVETRAQLSPGDLNRVHADLEGLANCEKCHEARRQISASRCLNCHTLLKERIAGGSGLHARRGYDDCVKCHVEHLGRESELIWWPDGRENFNHSQTGYNLEGKHAEVECRKCHSEKNIKSPVELAKAGKDPGRTFLGLKRDCLNCHKDQHRGQLGQDCLKCHGMMAWKSVTGFDHNKTDFPLTGRHTSLECTKCHPYIPDEADPQVTFLKLAGVKHDGCIDCHKDIHMGKFDQNCRTCHNTGGWKEVNRAGFDHGRTRFPLVGKHASAACDKCHKPGAPLTGLPFGRCVDCHSDFHRGTFAGRESRGECGECHSVSGFAPALFTIEDHQKTDYPLQGSHLAIPCELCHKSIYEDDGTRVIRFSFESTKCVSCHRDPHGESIRKLITAGGCESCHNINGWRFVSFDHSASGFALEKRHAEIACTACHKPIKSNDGKADLLFSGLSKECLTCHNDIHRGQFAEAGDSNGGQLVTRCGRCHTPGNWFPDKFVHNRDAKFKLEGAHLKVVCKGCHKKIEERNDTFVWFKPLDTACKSCHGSTILEPDGTIND